MLGFKFNRYLPLPSVRTIIAKIILHSNVGRNYVYSILVQHRAKVPFLYLMILLMKLLLIKKLCYYEGHVQRFLLSFVKPQGSS